MKHNKMLPLLVLFVLLLFVLLLAGPLGKPTFWPRTQAQARQTGEPKLVAVAKWEYCAITDDTEIRDHVFGLTGAAVIVSYFELSGRRHERIEYRPTQPAPSRQSQSYKDEALAKAMAKLGEEGWEMVGVKVSGENGFSVHYLFKRPKQ